MKLWSIIWAHGEGTFELEENRTELFGTRRAKRNSLKLVLLLTSQGNRMGDLEGRTTNSITITRPHRDWPRANGTQSASDHQSWLLNNRRQPVSHFNGGPPLFNGQYQRRTAGQVHPIGMQEVHFHPSGLVRVSCHGYYNDSDLSSSKMEEKFP